MNVGRLPLKALNVPLKKPTFHALPLILLVMALSVIHCLIGGGRPVFSLPAYGLLAAAGLLTFRARTASTGFPTSSCLAGTAVLFSYLLVRAALSPVPYLARADILLMLSCLVSYLLAAFVIITARQRLVVVGALLALGLLHTGVAVVQTALGEDFMLFGFLRTPAGSRASGMFISPNHLAGFLEIAGVLGLSVAWWSARKAAVRIFFGYATLCCYVGLLLSQSRGGVICAVFSLLVWGALTVHAGYLRNPRGFDRVLLFSLAAVIVLLGVGGWFVAEHIELRERLATALERDIRVANWQAALAQFRTAPVFGTGAGTHLYLGRLFRQPELQLDPIHAHSDYLELLAEYGLVGAAGMAFFLAAHAVGGLRALGRLGRALRGKPEAGSDALALVIGALAAFAAMAAHSVVDFNLHIPANALAMAFLFGILARPENPLPIPGAPAAAARARCALPVLGTVLLALVILAWPGELLTERARVQLRDEEYPEAAASATQALRLDPWNPFACFHLGEALRLQAELESAYADRQTRREQADRAFQQGLRIFPQDENLLVRRGQVLDRLRRFDEAEAAFQAAIAADPRLEILKEFYQRHRTLMEAGQPDTSP